MTLLSTRYALPLLALLVVCAAASAAQFLFPRRVDPCHSPDTLRATSLIPGTVAEGELLEKRGKVVIQWSEGHLEDGAAGGPAPLRFQIVRSFGSLLLYLQPLDLLGGALEAQDVDVRTVETGAGPIEVHIESTRARGRLSFVVYFYTHGIEAVSNPVVSKLRESVQEVLKGTQPVSLFAVTGETIDLGDARKHAESWLAAAFEHFDAACRAPETASPRIPAAS